MYDDEPDRGEPIPDGCEWCHGTGREPCSAECEDRLYAWEDRRAYLGVFADMVDP